MMKKNGFTLAEVLITLTIIGIVAVLTLPSLNANTQEQQARTALKKMTNTLSQAASLNSAIDGFDFSNLTQDSANDLSSATGHLATEGSLLRLIQDRCSIDTARGYALITDGTTIENVDTAAYFRDGTAVYFDGDQAKSTGSVSSVSNSKIAMDGLPVGIPVVFDINGIKGPNLVSNCSGVATGLTAWTADDEGVCGTSTKRVIKDQYIFRLRGTSAVPIGAASNWMVDNSKTAKPGNMEKFAMEASNDTGANTNTENENTTNP